MKYRRKKLLIWILIGLLLSGMVWRLRWPNPTWIEGLAAYSDSTRHALIVADDPGASAPQQVVYLEQGWSARQSMEFYTRPQGSLLIPYSWFMSLEQPDEPRPFLEPEHIARYRFLPQKPNACNPDGLPVGLVREAFGGDQPDWLGLTCAACHTTEIHYEQTAFRIDGAPAMIDLQGLLQQLTRSLEATLNQPDKWERFARKQIRNHRGTVNRETLKQEVQSYLEKRIAYQNRNHTTHAYGLARLDAFGLIMNEVLSGALDVDDPKQLRTPNAPVSFPFLWDTPHHDYVQWNAIARNKIIGSERLGALARNTGEVLGVFGKVDVSPPKTASVFTGYRSTARIPDLIELEGLLQKLQSPQWPKAFPAIDQAKRQAGELLFDRYCMSCHEPIQRSDPNRTVRAVKTPLDVVGTDPLMAKNFAERKAKTGRLEGRRSLFVTGKRFGAEASGDEVLVHTVVGIILNTPSYSYGESSLTELRKPSKEPDLDPSELLVYKARPLNGIWATAPYLHNGSVPNLYQLLLPAKERMPEFWVGRRTFDPKHIGFQTDPVAGGYLFRVYDEQGQPIPGNSNQGHEYGTGSDGLPALTDEQRWHLIEYLKSL